MALLGEIDRSLQDLWLFIPIWLQNIEKRRALLLRGDFEGATLDLDPTQTSTSSPERHGPPAPLEAGS